MNAAVVVESVAAAAAAAAAVGVAKQSGFPANGEFMLRVEGGEVASPRSGEESSGGLLVTDADSSAPTDRSLDKGRDVLQLLLSQANPHSVGSERIEDSGVEYAVPALDVAFPVMHAYNLQLTDTIPMQRGEVEAGRDESRDLLRPSVRLLCSIGRSLVAEQYRRQMPERMRLRGVKAPKVGEEVRKEEREHLHQTLPPTGVAAAKLRWRAKDLGGVYACTCVKAGCSFQPDSFLTLCRHVKEGHYRLRRLRQPPEKSWHCSRSPSVYYPVNPANTKALGSHGKNFYLCEECGLYFSTVKAIQAHYSGSHGKRRFDSSETCVWLLCPFCGEWMERESSRLPVCRVQLRSRPVEVVWGEIRQCTQGDPARAASVHVLASLLLFPNAQSPLCFTTTVARGIWSRGGGRCEGLRDRLGNAISAIRGVLRFTGKKRYRRVVEEGVDLLSLDDPGRTVCGEESKSEGANTVARKGARVVVKSLPANVPTVEVEGGSPVPLSSAGTVSDEGCQPTRKVIVIGRRVAEDGDKACCEGSVAEEGRQSWRNLAQSRNVEGEVSAKRLRCGSPRGVEVVWSAPLPSLLPRGGAAPPFALSTGRTADVRTGGVDARGAVPSSALSTPCPPRLRMEVTPSSSLSSSSSSSRQPVVQAPRRPCSFVLHHSVVKAASRREGGAVDAESEEGSTKTGNLSTASDGATNGALRKDLVAERCVWIARPQNGLSSARNNAVVGLGVTNGSVLSSARPLAPAVPLSLNVPAVMPVVAVSAASVGLSAGASVATVKPSSSNLCNDGKVETLSMVGTLPQLSMLAPPPSHQPVSSSISDTSESVAQRIATAPCVSRRMELAKAKSTSASSRQLKSPLGGYNLLVSRKTLDPSIANALSRMQKLPVVGKTSAPEVGGCNIAPCLLKLAPNVEQKVGFNVAPSVAQVPQVPTALTTSTGCSGGQASSVGSVAQMSLPVASVAVQPTKLLSNGAVGLLRPCETTPTGAESSSTAVGSACSVVLQSVASAQSAVQLKGMKMRSCGKNSRGSVRSGASAGWRRHSALLPRVLGTGSRMVKSCGGAQSVSAHAAAQRDALVSGEGEACSRPNWKCMDVEGGSGDVVASDAMMCPMCSFSSCDREAIMQHVIDAH